MKSELEAAVLSADVVVYSEHGIAVALYYDDPNSAYVSAPVCVARGKDCEAFRIIHFATKNAVPLYKKNSLAELLYEHTREEEEITPALYDAVAEALADCYRANLNHSNRVSRSHAPSLLRNFSFIELMEINLATNMSPIVPTIVSRCRSLRRRIAANYGFTFPSVRIRDDPKLKDGEYRIYVRGVLAGTHIVYPNRTMVFKKRATESDVGIESVEPVWRLPVIWVEGVAGTYPKGSGADSTYRRGVFDAPAVVATHLQHVVLFQAPRLLTYDRASQTVSLAGEQNEDLVKRLRERFDISYIQRILKELLREAVPIVDRLEIFETMLAHAAQKEDFAAVLAAVRRALGPMICDRLLDSQGRLRAIRLSQMLESALLEALNNSANSGRTKITGDAVDGLLAALMKFTKSTGEVMEIPVLITREEILRRPLFDSIRSNFATDFTVVHVLSESEIPPDTDIVVDHTLNFLDSPHETPPRSVCVLAGIETIAVEQIEESFEKWNRLFAKVQIDKDRLSSVVNMFYENRGLPPPRAIIWCAHPAIPLLHQAMFGADVIDKNFQVANLSKDLLSHDKPESEIRTLLNGLVSRDEFLQFGDAPGPQNQPVRPIELSEMVIQSLVTRAASIVREKAAAGPLRALMDAMQSAGHWLQIGDFDLTASVKAAFADALEAGGLDRTNLDFQKVIDSTVDLIVSNPGRFRQDWRSYYPSAIWDIEELISRSVALSMMADRTTAVFRWPGYQKSRCKMQTLIKDGDLVMEFIANGGWLCRFLSKYAFVVLRPSRITTDVGGRLHSDSKPAVVLADAGKLYFHHGVCVHPRVILDPDSLSLDEVMKESNAEVRRVMIARMGVGAFLKRAQPAILNEDKDNLGNPRRLYRIELPGDEPMVVLHVVDPAKLRLGMSADVFLRVPPNSDGASRAAGGLMNEETEFWSSIGGKLATCKQAVAWTFRFQPDDYVPVVET